MSLFDCLVIGIEMHIRPTSLIKLFSRQRASYKNSASNSSVGSFEIAKPGTYPVMDPNIIACAHKASTLFNCSNIERRVYFDRKHYSYFDLPHGYQITQQRYPMGVHGKFNGISIREAHIEVDSARRDLSQNVDFNRLGCPLIEVVTEPEFHNHESLIEFCELLAQNFRLNSISECRMEEGEFRVDLNISSQMFPRKQIEVKNLASYSDIKAALTAENLPNVFDESVRATCSLRRGALAIERIKQSHNEYMYIPEFDIEPIFAGSISIDTLDFRVLVSLLQQHITDTKVIQAMIDKKLHNIFLYLVKRSIPSKVAVNFVMNPLLKVLNRSKISAADITHESLEKIAQAVESELTGKASPGTAKASLLNILSSEHSTESGLALSAAHEIALVEFCDTLLFLPNQKVENYGFLINRAQRFCLQKGLPFIKNSRLVSEFIRMHFAKPPAS